MTFHAWEVEPEASEVEPERLKVDPEGSEVEPERWEVDPEALEVDPENFLRAFQGFWTRGRSLRLVPGGTTPLPNSSPLAGGGRDVPRS